MRHSSHMHATHAFHCASSLEIVHLSRLLHSSHCSRSMQAADHMADADTINKLCKNQRDRIRFAARTAGRQVASHTLVWFNPDLERRSSSSSRSSNGNTSPSNFACNSRAGSANVYTPPDNPPMRLSPQPRRSRRRKASAALRHLLCCGRPGACQARVPSRFQQCMLGMRCPKILRYRVRTVTLALTGGYY